MGNCPKARSVFPKLEFRDAGPGYALMRKDHPDFGGLDGGKTELSWSRSFKRGSFLHINRAPVRARPILNRVVERKPDATSIVVEKKVESAEFLLGPEIDFEPIGGIRRAKRGPAI